MEDIHADLTHYAKCLEVFYGRNTDGHHKGWYRDNITSVVQKSYMKGSGPLKILSVGCGPGEPDSFILDQLLLCYDVIHYTAVEPGKDHFQQFMDNVKNNPQYAKVNFEVINDTAEEFITTEREERYHLIMFQHVLYYVDSVEDTLRNYYPLLTANGCLLAIIVNDQQGAWSIWPQFRDLFRQFQHVYISATDIQEALEKLNYSYRQVPVSSQFEVSSILEDTQEGSLLLDFLIHIKNFRKGAPPEKYNAVVERIKELAEEDPVSKRMTMHWLAEVFIVAKT